MGVGAAWCRGSYGLLGSGWALGGMYAWITSRRRGALRLLPDWLRRRLLLDRRLLLRLLGRRLLGRRLLIPLSDLMLMLLVSLHS